MPLLFIFAIFLFSCANAPSSNATAPAVSQNQEKISASQTPAIPNSYKELEFPAFQYVPPHPADYRHAITDSITLYAARDTTLPLVDLTFYFKQTTVPKNHAELAQIQLLSSLYSKGGTENLTPAQVDDSLEFLSARLSASIDFTQNAIRLNCLSRDLPKVLPLLAELFNKPRLDSARLELQKAASIQSWQHRYDNPSGQLAALNGKVLYKDNPKLWVADSAAIANVKRQDLLALKDRFFAPNRVIIAAAGDFNTDSLINTLSKMFDSWKPPITTAFDSSAARKGDFALQLKEAPLIFNEETGIFASEKNISQANIILAQPFIKRPHPDYYPTSIASYILGGSSFSSRLMNKVRTQNGLAYSVYSFARSDYDDQAISGVALQTKVESAGTALALIKEEFQKLAAEGATAEELEFAKKSIIESMPAMFESPSATANTFAVSEFYNRSLDHFKEYPQKIREVSHEQIKAMAAKYFNPDSMRISIVAPIEKLKMENVKEIPLKELP